MYSGHPATGESSQTKRALDALDGDAQVTRGSGSVAAECPDRREDLALPLGQGLIPVMLDHEHHGLAGTG